MRGLIAGYHAAAGGHPLRLPRPIEQRTRKAMRGPVSGA